MEQKENRQMDINMDDNMAKSINRRQEVIKKKKKKRNTFVPLICLGIGLLIGILGTVLIASKGNDSEESKGKEEGNKVGQVDIENSSEECFAIDTINGDVYYPLKWKEQVRVQSVEDDIYTLEFWGTVGKQGEHLLFSITFGGEEGTYIGDWNDTPIYINSATNAVTNEWSDDDKTIFYSMQEDVNYIIDMLQQEADFVPVS